MSRQWVPSSFNSLKRESWRPQPTSSWTPTAHSTTDSGAAPNQAGPSGSARRSPSPSQSRTRRLSSDYSRRDQPTSSYRPQPRNAERSRSRSRSRSRDRDDRRDRSRNGHGRVNEEGGRGSTDRKSRNESSPDGRRDRDRADERGSGHDRNRDFDGDRDRDRRRSKEWNAKPEDRSWGGWKDKVDTNRQDDRRDDSRRSNGPNRNDTGGRSWHAYNERGSNKKKKVDSRVSKGFGKPTDLYRPTPTGPRAHSKARNNGRGRRDSPDYGAPPRRDSPRGRRDSPDYAVGADRDRSRGRSDSSSTASSTLADRKRRPVSPRRGNSKRFRERSPTISDSSQPRQGRSPSREAPFTRRASSPSPTRRPSGRGKYSPGRDSPTPPPPPRRRSPSPPRHRSPSPPRRPRSPLDNQISARNRSPSPGRAASPPSGWKRQNLASQDDLFRSGGPGRPEDRAPGRWGRHPPDRRPANSDRRRDHEPARSAQPDWHARGDQNRSQQGAERNGNLISPTGNGNHHQTWQPPASDSFGTAPGQDTVPSSPLYRNGHLHSVHEQLAVPHAHDAQHLPHPGAAPDSQLAAHAPEPVRISFGSNGTNGSGPTSMKHGWNTTAPPPLKTPLQRIFNDTTPTSSKRTSPSPPDVDMDIEPSPGSAGPPYSSRESVLSEAQYSAHLSTIAPYIQAAFSQWWSQNATPTLHDFLVHYFGRPPSQTEVSQIQQLLSMRRELNNGNQSGRPYQQGPSEGYRPAPQGAPTTFLAPPTETTAVLPSPPSESNDSRPAKASRTGDAYDLLTCVGEGTYGKVYKAKKNDTGLIVALKRIRMEGEKDGFPVTAMREIKLLQNLRHENVIRLHEMMVSKGSVYMVFEYMEHDLTGLLSLHDINLTPANLKSLNYQMLSGLAYLHDKSILHRDMKGSNILLNARGELKLGDFGLARVYSKFKRDDYTNRVITLWYRSPELLLGETVYGPTVDTFSAGCIMLELFTTKPVFQGNDEIHQLEVIYSILGTPSEEDWPDVKDLPWYELVKPKESLPSKFREIFSKWLSPAALDLAQGLLAFDPARRLLADQAMQTPYFTSEAPAMEKPLQLSGIGEHHEMSAKADRHRRRQEGK